LQSILKYGIFILTNNTATQYKEIDNMKSFNREEVLAVYSLARKNYLENTTNENWVIFCKARRDCMLLGIRI
jgi:hypothetical protein